MEPIKLKAIIGSTRPERGAGLVLPWLLDRLDRDARFDVEVLDLRDWALPMFQETWDSVRRGYSTDVVRRWNETISGGEATYSIRSGTSAGNATEAWICCDDRGA